MDQTSPEPDADVLPDQVLQAAVLRRSAQRVAAIPEPKFPATGTARIAELLANARLARDKSPR